MQKNNSISSILQRVIKIINNLFNCNINSEILRQSSNNINDPVYNSNINLET